MTYRIAHSKQVFDVEIDNPRNGENPVLCPFCAHTRKPEHQSEKKLSIRTDVFPKKWNCVHCERGGYVLEKEYLESLPIKPVFNVIPTISVSDRLVKWFFEERSISIKTLRHFNIRMSEETLLLNRVLKGEESLKGGWYSRKCINFNYYLNGLLINIKFRDIAKNFKLLKGASLIMYNLDSIKDSDYAVITEGEFEPMSYYEAGITPVVSVPNGSAVSPSEVEQYKKTGHINLNTGMDMTYLDNCIDLLKHLKTIYLATDDDAAGYKLREMLAMRLGKDRCKYIEFSQWKRADGSDCNDPNDVLHHCGKEQLSYSLNKAKSYPLKNVVRAKDLAKKIEFNYDNETPPGLSIGYKTLDPHWRWMPGYFYALNGWPQMGKTIFMMNLGVISASLYGFKWGIYSPENYPIDQLIETVAEIYIGNTVQYGYSSKQNPRASKESLMSTVMEFIYSHFHFIEDRIEGYTPEQLRTIKLRLWESHGVNCFFTDPWKNLIHDDSIALERYLNRELSQEVRFTAGNNVINVISSHPPTPERGKPVPDVPSPYMMYGGAVWNNSVYGMAAIHRVARTSMDNTKVELHVQKMKNQKLAGVPTQDPVILDFSRRSNRYLEEEVIGSGKYETFPLDTANVQNVNLFTQF